MSAKKNSKPWRRGQRLGPGLIDWTADTTCERSGYACALCGRRSAKQDSNSTVDVKVTTLPGVRDHRSTIICRTCDSSFRGNCYCAGCDKLIVDVYEPGTTMLVYVPAGAERKASLEVGGRFEVWVCGDQRGWSADTSPKLVCSRRARLALSLCPAGCGGSAVPGEMCDSCYDLCAEGKRVRQAERLCSIPIWIPDPLRSILGRAVTGRAALSPELVGSSRVEVNVTESQAQAIGELEDALKSQLAEAEARGFRKGNSFLTRLAQGSVSLDELNKHSVEGSP